MAGFEQLPDVLRSSEAQAALAGASGGLVRTLRFRTGWVDGVSSVIVGALCSIYLHPLAMPLLFPTLGRMGLSDHQLLGLSGMLTGMAGMALVGLVLDTVASRRKSDLAKQENDREQR